MSNSQERMTQIINENRGTKMRFIDKEPLQMKEYIVHGGGTSAIQTLKTRLNMHRVYGNFKGGYEIPRLCPHCLLEEDTTEHLLLCPYFGQANLSTEGSS